MIHIPVLQKEVLNYLQPKPNENFIDATIGEGGYTFAVLNKNKPKGRVLGIEIDENIYQEAKRKMAEFSDRLILVNDSYINLKEIVKRNKFEPVDGILFDLGMSSWHLEKSGRGFSFLRDEPLIMRYTCSQVQNKTGLNLKNLTAEAIVNQFPEEKLVKIFREYGEERFARRIAGKICEERKRKLIKTTFQLKSIVIRAIPKKIRYSRIRCLARIFQSLRIAVNNELDNLEKVLPQTIEILKPGGRLVVISFHSLEDRIVKNFLKDESKKGRFKILTKKPVIADLEEIKVNPRARSAKLRAAIKS